MQNNNDVGIGKFYTFYGKKYKCVGFRSTKERAEMVKSRLERIGTIKIHIVKHQYTVIGLLTNYSIWARPEKVLSWEKLDKVIERLF